MNKLTIAIPTYNRNLILKKNLNAILEQDLSSVEILILDNYSLKPVIEDIQEEVITHNIKYIRNQFNIGAAANMVRCFEIATTRWIWVLGDDDIPDPDCIKKILADIETYDNYCAINYKTVFARNRDKDTTTNGFTGLINQLDDFGNLLLISTNVYNRALLMPQIIYAHMYIYSEALHLALLFASVGNEGKVFLSKKNIVKWNVDDMGMEWSYERLGHRIAVLNDFSVIYKVDDRIAKKLAQHIQTHIMPLSMLLKMGVKKLENEQLLNSNDRYYMEQGFYRDPLQQGSFIKLFRLFVYRAIINSRFLLRTLFYIKYVFIKKKNTI
ncbi:MAG TPA: glycosyltransferase [Ferruginibacter sp.]|jgi:glycosyltransferase involved in cell wall biosynthesis|nr:glycosyltransferase [Ferruginibacter sp.]